VHVLYLFLKNSGDYFFAGHENAKYLTSRLARAINRPDFREIFCNNWAA